MPTEVPEAVFYRRAAETICNLYRSNTVSNNPETESIEGPVRALVRACVRKQFKSSNLFEYYTSTYLPNRARCHPDRPQATIPFLCTTLDGPKSFALVKFLVPEFGHASHGLLQVESLPYLEGYSVFGIKDRMKEIQWDHLRLHFCSLFRISA